MTIPAAPRLPDCPIDYTKMWGDSFARTLNSFFQALVAGIPADSHVDYVGGVLFTGFTGANPNPVGITYFGFVNSISGLNQTGTSTSGGSAGVGYGMTIGFSSNQPPDLMCHVFFQNSTTSVFVGYTATIREVKCTAHQASGTLYTPLGATVTSSGVSSVNLWLPMAANTSGDTANVRITFTKVSRT